MLVHILIFRNSESDLTKRTVSAFSGCASQWKGLMGNAGSAWRSWEGQGSGQGQGGSGVGFPGPCLHVGPAGMDTSLLAHGQWGNKWPSYLLTERHGRQDCEDSKAALEPSLCAQLLPHVLSGMNYDCFCFSCVCAWGEPQSV